MLRQSVTAQVGLALTLLVVLAAVFASAISPHDPYEQDVLHRLAEPFWATGDASHLLGTDSLGRDLLSRIVYGAQISLLIGVSAVLLSGIVGVPLGLIAGYYPGRWDAVIMRLADIQLAVPTLVLTLALVAAFGASLANLVIVLGVTGWVIYARVVRSEVLSARNAEYVEAARALGARDVRILLGHVLPNVMASIIVISSLRVATTILLEATLSFLGLGVQPPTPTWGGMVAEGRSLIYRAWWVGTFPGLAIVVAVLGTNLLGDWLRDVFDPRIRE